MKTSSILSTLFLLLLSGITINVNSYEPQYKPTVADIHIGIGMKEVDYLKDKDSSSIEKKLGIFNLGFLANPIFFLPLSKYFDLLIGYDLFHNFSYKFINDKEYFDTSISAYHNYLSHNLSVGVKRNIIPFIDIAFYMGIGAGKNEILKINSVESSDNPDTIEVTRKKFTTYIMPGIEFVFPIPQRISSLKIGLYLKKEFHKNYDLFISNTDIGYHFINQENFHFIVNAALMLGHIKNKDREEEKKAGIESKQLYISLQEKNKQFNDLYNNKKYLNAYNKYIEIYKLRESEGHKLYNLKKNLRDDEFKVYSNIQNNINILKENLNNAIKQYFSACNLDDKITLEKTINLLQEYPDEMAQSYIDSLIHIKTWIEEGFSFTESEKWIKQGFNIPRAKVWRNVNFTPEQARIGEALNCKPQTASNLKELNISSNTIKEWKESGYSCEDAYASLSNGVNFEEFNQWHQIESNITLDEIIYLKNLKFSIEEASAWKQHGFDIHKISRSTYSNISAFKWRENGFDHIHASNWIKVDPIATPERVKGWKKIGFTPQKLEKYFNNTGLKIKEWEPNELKSWIDAGFKGREIAGWCYVTAYPNVAKKWKNAGFTPDVASQYNIEVYGPQDVKKMRSFCPNGTSELNAVDVYSMNPYDCKSKCFKIEGRLFQSLSRTSALFETPIGIVFIDFGAKSHPAFADGCAKCQGAYVYHTRGGVRKTVHKLIMIYWQEGYGIEDSKLKFRW